METHSLMINSLPTEVLDKIFSYLTFYDVKAVRGVCRRWLDITLHSSYTRHNKINIRNFNFLPHTLEMGENLLNADDESAIGLSFIYQTVKLNFKDYAHCDEYYDEFERNVKLFMKFNGDNVKNLTLVDFHAMKEPRLFKLCGEIIDSAPNLENLCLNNTQFDGRLFLNGKGETNRGAQNLKQLSLVPWSVRLVEYDELEYLGVHCQKLQSLTWLNAHALFDEKAIDFFKSMTRRIKKLKIHNTVAEELVREKNIQILSDFQLVSLDMKFDTSVVPSVVFAKFVEFIKNQRHTLTDLTIYCSDNMMQHFDSVYSALLKLERLKVVYDGVDIVDLTGVLAQPRKLKISSTGETHDRICAIRKPTNFASLKYETEPFCLHEWNEAMNNEVLEIYVKMTNEFSHVQPVQNNLKLLNCNVCASSQFLNAVNNFTNLVALRVTLFTMPALNALCTFYSSLTKLKYIYLEITQKNASNSNENEFDALLPYNISNFKGLQCLGILTKENTYIPGCEFEHITKLKCLQKLICKVQVKPSDTLFDEFFKNAKSLNYLDVRQSHGIDDDAVDRIFQNLNHLSYIGLAGCSNVRDTNAALDKMKIINNRVKYNNDFPEDFDEEFVSKYLSM